MGLSARVTFILSVVAVVSLIVATVIGLTIGLRTPAPADGGSPPPIYTTDLPPDGTTQDLLTFPPSEMIKTRFASVDTDAPLCSEIGTCYNAESNFEVNAPIIN